MNIQEQEEYDYGMGGFGDPRRCEFHGCKTSSDDGMFDAPCPECEGEIYDAEYEDCMKSQAEAEQEPMHVNRLAHREGLEIWPWKD